MGIYGPDELIVDQKYCRQVIQAIKSAKYQILICSYSWKTYPNEPEREIQKVYTEIARAVARGVSVRVLADKYTQIRPLLDANAECRYIGKYLTMHTKAVCIDKETLLLGSHNLTARANEHNHELSIKTSEPEVLYQFAEYFNAIWNSLDSR